MFNIELHELYIVFLPMSFIFGALFGSFANVCILRYQSGESIVSPGSRCPNCRHPLSWSEKIPILSWLVLKGKCRHCQFKISSRYLFVELLTGLIFLATFSRFGFSISTLELLIFFWGLIVVSFIDIDSYLLPDVYTLPGICLGLAGAMINPERTVLDSVLGLFLGGGFLWAVAYFYFLIRKEEGMGGGDIKLLAWMGAVLGAQSIAFIILASSVIGSLVGLWIAYSNSKNSTGQMAGVQINTESGPTAGSAMKTVIPFGPSLALGAVLYVFIGQELASLYSEFFFPYLTSMH